VNKEDAQALAATLGLELYRDGVCLPCLTFVAFPLGDGDTREAARGLRQVLPTLWVEGLDKVAFRVVREAAEAGKPHAAEALDDLERRGMRSAIAHAIVMRLAEAMVVDMRAMWN
jgi:hypothetical protein